MKLIKRTSWGYTIHSLDGKQTGASVGLPVAGWFVFVSPERTWNKRGIAYVREA